MPNIPLFKLERYFAKYEFSVKYLLSSSDCEALTLRELVEMASPESLELWNNLKLSYTESPGHPVLRHEISGDYTHISPNNILVAVPEEAIYLLMQTFLHPGDQIIVISPTYQSLSELASSIGCEVLPWELQLGSTSWEIDINWLEDHLSDSTRLLVLNFPNNPTGFLPSLSQFDSILALAAKHGITVFCDEMYRMLEEDPSQRLPSVCEVYEKGIALSGLSKAYALPGLRIGWLATRQKDIIADCLGYKDYTTICHSAPSEILAIIALENRNRIITHNLEIIRSNLELARRFFALHSNSLAWTEPQAGSIAFPRWLGPGSVEDFSEALLNEQGLMLVPGSLFDHKGNHFRLGLGRINFAEGLEHLDDFLTSHHDFRV